MAKWSWVFALCLSLPIAAHADEEKKPPEKAKPFRKGDFSVHSAQALNKGSVAITASMGYPFIEAGVLYGIGGILNVGANIRSEWTLTVGGDVNVMASLYKTKKQAIGLKVEGGFLTLGTGDAELLAFGPGTAGVGDGSLGGLPHAFSATTHADVTPQVVYSYKDTIGTWYLSGGATFQQFLEQPLDLPADVPVEMAIMPRVTVGLEQISRTNISFHMEALAGAYIDPNDPANAAGKTISAVVMAQIGLNLFLP